MPILMLAEVMGCAPSRWAPFYGTSPAQDNARCARRRSEQLVARSSVEQRTVGRERESPIVEHEAFDTGEAGPNRRVVRRVAAGDDHRLALELDLDLREAAIEHGRVLSGAAVHAIHAGPEMDRVVAGTAKDAVVAAVAGEPIRALAAVEQIVAIAARQAV